MHHNVKAMLTRQGRTIIVVIRQLPHDVPVLTGSKFRYGSGAMWRVVSVEPMED